MSAADGVSWKWTTEAQRTPPTAPPQRSRLRWRAATVKTSRARLPRAPGIRKIVLDLHARFANVAQTTLYVTIEAPLQKSVDRHRRLARHLLEVDGSAEHVGQRMGNRLPVEQLLAREHLPQDDAERPDVRALVDRLAGRLLR